MPESRFANILFETNPRALAYPGMYYKTTRPVFHDDDKDEWLLYGAGTYDFSTYFNSLSVMKLRRYTIAKGFKLHLETKGAAFTFWQTRGVALSKEAEKLENTQHHIPASDDWQSLDIDLADDVDTILIGFILQTDGIVAIRNSYYSVVYDGEPRHVELAIASTTFKKETYITSNINLIKKSIVAAGDDFAHHFHMYVIDNGRTLDAKALSDDAVTVIPNDNVGGAGGFTRGMLAAMDQKPRATHVLLMDDDVAVSQESIRRTYNLLRFVNDEYKDAFISGAMLSFTIAEDQSEDVGWMTLRGTFAPTKPPLRITKYEDLVYNETFVPLKEMRGQRYAAWWYCVIPITQIEKNGLPLPFFVRCDDAEYGIRCQPKFMSMNGLCVWHMPFQVRYNAAVERYQTTRNTMVAQAVTGMAPRSDFLKELHNNIRLELKKFNYADAALTLDAFEDYLRGPEWFSQPGIAMKRFLDANKHKEKFYSFDEVLEQAKKYPELKDFTFENIDRQLIDGDKPRSFGARVEDLITDNGQRLLHTAGRGYRVIPNVGWAYPAGIIRGTHLLVVVDWYNRKAAIRVKNIAKYQEIVKRYHRDLAWYRRHGEELHQRYAASRAQLTSEAYWRHYLKMEPSRENA